MLDSAYRRVEIQLCETAWNNVIGGPVVTADQLARIVEPAWLPHVDIGIFPPHRTKCHSPSHVRGLRTIGRPSCQTKSAP
ncbi:Scr1 family TA system antitoxin-like transcriptional regulator [Nocardia sp. NPDC004260]